jgi:hypothetical protein
MKTNLLRLLSLAALLALFMGCRSNNTMDTGEFVELRDSQPYSGPNAGFYDPWYGGSGAYYGSGYYGGASVGVGISVPVNR